MLKQINKYKAQSTLEFMVLLFFILGAFLVFQKYIVRSISGRWKTVGDSFGYGRQFDPKKTRECAYDHRFFNIWYNETCFDKNCDCLTIDVTCGTCEANYNAMCRDCIRSCEMPECN